MEGYGASWVKKASYRLDHAVTATQKTILRAFDMDAAFVRSSANELSDILMNYENELTGEE